MKRIAAWLLSVALLCGCSRDHGHAAGREKVFVMIPKVVGPYYEPCFQGFQDAAKKYGVKVEYKASKAMEVPQQVEIIENVIARGVDGIAVSALDDQGLMGAINEAAKAGIKIVTFDAPAPSSQALTYIGTMNEAAGAKGAETLAKAMNMEGDVAVMQAVLGSANLNDRYRGFENWLKANAPKIHIVAREDDQGKVEVVVNKTEALLEAHPNLKAIFGVSAEVCPGAAAALKQQGKGGKVILAGFDDIPDTIAAVKNGLVDFCIAQRTYKMGWLSVEKLLDATENKPLAREFDTGVLVVNKDNADSYMKEARQEFVH